MRLYRRPTKTHTHLIYLTQEEVDTILGSPRESAEFLIDIRVLLRIKREAELDKQSREQGQKDSGSSS